MFRHTSLRVSTAMALIAAMTLAGCNAATPIENESKPLDVQEKDIGYHQEEALTADRGEYVAAEPDGDGDVVDEPGEYITETPLASPPPQADAQAYTTTYAEPPEQFRQVHQGTQYVQLCTQPHQDPPPADEGGHAVQYYGTLLGRGNYPAQYYGIVLGQGNHAVQYYGTVLGRGNHAVQYYGTILGQGNHAAQYYGTLLGQGNHAAQHYGTLLGQGNYAVLSSATVLGQGNHAAQHSGTVLNQGNHAAQDPVAILTRTDEVIRLTNAQRSANGRADLTIDSVLMELAAVRAGEISRYFSHTRPNGENAVIWVFNHGFLGAGENLAWGRPSMSASQAISAWMNSPGHMENILREGFTHIGAAHFRSGGQDYWVQLFAIV